jgi:hypothetical protein
VWAVTEVLNSGPKKNTEGNNDLQMLQRTQGKLVKEVFGN